MAKLTFEYDGKTYEVYGRDQNPRVSFQPHIYEVETNRVPVNQMKILKRYLFANGFPKDELEGKTTHELVYMMKKYLLSK